MPLSKLAMIKPSMAWLLVFVPAVSYFMATRLQSSGFRWGRSSRLGEPVTTVLTMSSSTSTTTSRACRELAHVVYLAAHNCDLSLQELPLQDTLNLLYQGRGMQDIVASTWRHDDELGRGYLLFSQSHANGRIWRWEVGGGPIAIGRSLHLESSGCRSNHYHTCVSDDIHKGRLASSSSKTTKSTQQRLIVGSGGMAIDFHQGQNKDHASEGALVVAEWGEGRIVRMEQSNGARTPLLIQVPNVCTHEGVRRLHQPASLLYTPFGELLVADHFPDCQRAAIFGLSQAVHVPPLESLLASRHAHAWNTTTHHHSYPIRVVFQQGVQQIGGMALDPTWLQLLVTVKDQHGHVLLLRIPISTMEDEDDDDEDLDQDKDRELQTQQETDESTTSEDNLKGSTKPLLGIMDGKAQMIMNMTHELGLVEPGLLAVSEKGHVFVPVPQGIAIILLSTSTKNNNNNNNNFSNAIVLGTLAMPQPPTSLTLGEDHFLYAFSNDSMYRIHVRVGPVRVPTNLVAGKPKESKS